MWLPRSQVCCRCFTYIFFSQLYKKLFPLEGDLYDFGPGKVKEEENHVKLITDLRWAFCLKWWNTSQYQNSYSSYSTVKANALDFSRITKNKELMYNCTGIWQHSAIKVFFTVNHTHLHVLYHHNLTVFKQRRCHTRIHIFLWSKVDTDKSVILQSKCITMRTCWCGCCFEIPPDLLMSLPAESPGYSGPEGMTNRMEFNNYISNTRTNVNKWNQSWETSREKPPLLKDHTYQAEGST